MTEEQVGFNLADLKKLCKPYIDYTRTFMDDQMIGWPGNDRRLQPVGPDNNYLFQFSSNVEDFSSQYGSDISISYTASNLTGRPSKFPNYGDFPQSYVMRTYGPWKEYAPSRKCSIMPQNAGLIKSEDFIILSFDVPVVPLVISIFETFTPGSVVRILGKAIDVPEVSAWKLLWEGPPQSCNNLRHSRLFSPKLKSIKEKIKEVCIEFNHSQLNYYTELDAVSLGGILQYPENGGLELVSIPFMTHTTARYMYNGIELDDHELFSDIKTPDIQMSTSLDPFYNLIKNIEDLENEWRKPLDYTLQLPDETLINIFSYLDLKSLRLCMRVCKRFNNICKDGYFYKELNFKPYWPFFSSSVLSSLQPYCTRLTKLDLSWCGITRGVATSLFSLFLQKCGTNLTHLRLDSCQFVNASTLVSINLHCKFSLKELSLRSCTNIEFDLIQSANKFPEMESIDLYRTNIDTPHLESYLVHMPKLKHINLGSCKKISSMDRIAYILAIENRKLISVDFWKSYTLSPNGLRFLINLKHLEEIDLGWCLGLSIPGDSLLDLVKSCSRLKKIIVVSLRGVCDRDLLAFADYCPLLEQIDLVGLRAITVDACSKFLTKCKHLKLMDVNFCENIKEADVEDWRIRFPNVCIQFTISEHLNVYHY